MNDWWQQLNPRQRLILLAGAAVLAALAIFTLAWEPLAQAREQARERVAQQQALADWMDAIAPVARALEQQRGQPAGSAQANLTDGRSLLGVVDATARAAGLAGAIQRIEPAGQDQVRIWLDQAGFAILMHWLEALATEHGIRVVQFTAERGDSDGAVNTRITLERDA